MILLLVCKQDPGGLAWSLRGRSDLANSMRDQKGGASLHQVKNIPIAAVLERPMGFHGLKFIECSKMVENFTHLATHMQNSNMVQKLEFLVPFLTH